MTKTKIIAAYLPQFHETEENNKWWGKGYTDWVAVKKSIPEFEGHIQPRTPLDDNYYSLDNPDNIRWQSNLAKEYGIYGFAMYHYWFSDKQNLLKTPSELLLENKDIDMNFMFVWDNNSWVNKTWKNVKFTNEWAPAFENQEEKSSENGILAELIYGGEQEWKKHYDYLSPFFKDKRYIKDEGRPVFGIFAPTNDRETILQMTKYLNTLAIQDGFKGILFISAATFSRKRLEMDFRYEPFNVCSPIDYLKKKLKNKEGLKIYSYDKIWKKILFNSRFLRSKRSIYGAFVGYDDTPRRGNSASIVLGQTPEKFRKYLSKLVKISEKQNKKYIYMTAWNEWGEGAYLEPDNNSKFEYLEALKSVVNNEEIKK